MPAQKRIYGLDILRAAAILLVVYGHGRRFFSDRPPTLFDGVSLFFVLSGFLIGSILLKIDFSFYNLFVFWKRRWFRTLPAYFTMLAILFIYYYSIGKATSIRYFFFTQSLSSGRGAALYDESWSLCVEEWFYFLIPILLLLSAKIYRRNTFPIVIVAVIGAVTILRIYNATLYHSFTDWDMRLRRATFLRMDSIMFGVLGAYLKNTRLWSQHKLVYFIIGAAIFAGTKLNTMTYGANWYLFYVNLTAQSIAGLLLLPLLSNIKTGNGIVYKAITFISTISYSIYLLHDTPFSILSAHFAFLNNFFCYIAFAFGAAYILYRVIEKPFMDLRETLIPARTSRGRLIKIKSVGSKVNRLQ